MTKSKSTSHFDRDYQHLNREQRQAVYTLDGPVMVVAGPGTGKTQTIALRIANIIRQTDTHANNILALTFTDSGARAMKTRLASLIGADAFRVHIHTFHSFAGTIIQENPDQFSLLSGEPISDLGKLKIIYQALDTLKPKLLRPIGAPGHYATAILSAISQLKREGVTPIELSQLLATQESDKSTQKNLELVEVYQHYQQILKERSTYDFDDMVSSVVSAFHTSPELLLSYQERYHYLLVDEYQDSNNAQNELVLSLASYWGPSANLFVTGDPDQSVMRFQGASIENQLTFIEKYPQATVITLRTNYRSPQVILDAADSVISHNHLRINDVVPGLDSHLESVSKSHSLIRSVTVPDPTSELAFIANDIAGKLASGVLPSSIAILYRKNSDATELSRVLAQHHLDYQIEGGSDLLTTPTIRQVITLLRALKSLRDSSDGVELFTIMHYPYFHLDPLDCLLLPRAAHEQQKSLFELLSNSELLDSLNLVSRPAVDQFTQLLLRLNTLSSNLTFVEFLEVLLQETGLLPELLSRPDSFRHLSHLTSLFDVVKNMNRENHNLNLAEFLENLNLMSSHQLRLVESHYATASDAITLTTAHKSKGLEWDHVYLYKCLDGVWGNNRRRELIKLPDSIVPHTNLRSKDDNEEERCLFYVGMTRAKQELTLTRATTTSQGGKTRIVSDSLFLAEIGDANLSPELYKPSPSSSDLATLLQPAPVTSSSVAEQAFLTPLVEKFKLSPTALNLYLQCPYKFKLEKILRLPQAKKPHLAFGTAIHKALELFYQEFKDTSLRPPKDFLLSSFTTALKHELLTPLELSVRETRGKELLSAYYDIHQDDVRPPLFLEQFIQVSLDDIILTGKLDRVEWLDESDRSLRVIDYKTGSAKTLGQIKGTTQDSDGALLRQLIFYRLLIDLNPRLNQVSFGEGVLDFVEEPLVKGKDGTRRLRISDDQLKELKATIRSVMQEIRALHFPRTTDLKACQSCPFLNHCYPDGISTVN